MSNYLCPWGWTHTHTHTKFANKSNFKKLGWLAPGLKLFENVVLKHTSDFIITINSVIPKKCCVHKDICSNEKSYVCTMSVRDLTIHTLTEISHF